MVLIQLYVPSSRRFFIFLVLASCYNNGTVDPIHGPLLCMYVVLLVHNDCTRPHRESHAHAVCMYAIESYQSLHTKLHMYVHMAQYMELQKLSPLWQRDSDNTYQG